MAIAQIEGFLRLVMTDAAYCRRFLDDPAAVLEQTELDSGERWAVLESLSEGDHTGQEFLALLRTRLAAVGVLIGRPPAHLTQVFATAHDPGGPTPADPDAPAAG